MRSLLLVVLLGFSGQLFAQHKIEDWIAPEGRILNYRTLNWKDFQNKEDQEHAEKNAAKNLQALAYVCPSIYMTSDSGELLDNGRVTFKFHVKCAFQTRSFVRESTMDLKSNYVLIHEQDHYDIALTFANKLYSDLSTRDFDKEKYKDEVDKIYKDLMDKYHNVQKTYDGEVNPEGTEDTAKQSLWDMRIKKGMENNSIDFYGSPLTDVITVKSIGQSVKRRDNEAPLQFAVRCRPLYWELPEEMMKKATEVTEWTKLPAVLAFYTQRFFDEENKECYRTLGCLFFAQGNGQYKRSIIDTFYGEGQPVKIESAFFANCDTDQAKELIIVASSPKKDKAGNGTIYINKVFDNINRALPGKLRRLDDAGEKIQGGLEGYLGGKPSKAKFKNEKEILDGLKKLGYNN